MKHTEKISYSYVNGQYIPQTAASIPIQDRGFRFGDGIFDTIAIYDGVPYQWQYHINRIKEGLASLKINADTQPLSAICKKLLQQNTHKEGFLRIAITRGSGSHGYLPAITTEPTIVVETLPKIHQFTDTVSLWHSNYIKPNSVHYPVQCKTMQGLNSTLARIEAQENHCFDALLCNSNNHICETSSANIFWINQHTIYTPSLECGVLAGTTRQIIQDIAPYPVKEGTFTLDDLAQAEGVFITNVAWQILPVSQLYPHKFTWSSELDIYATLVQQLHEHIAKYVTHHKKQWVD